jgi:hypothetical protein
MSEYRPELLNELTRIVLTTRNDNPSVAEYEQDVLPAWKRCEGIMAGVTESRPPTLEEMREVYRNVLAMLRAKHVPESEIAERVEEAFERSERARVYAFERRAIVEAGQDMRVGREMSPNGQRASLNGLGLAG